MPDTLIEERIGEVSGTGRFMPNTISEERVVYVIPRRREVRCRLWFQVTPFREGLNRFFLLRIEELE